MTIDDRELDRRLDSLTRQVPADESLWPRIERQTRSPRRWPAVAAIAASVGAGAMFVALSILEDNTAQPAGYAQREAEAMRAVSPDAMAVSRVDASPSLQSAWRANQSAIEELERALQRDPDNRLLLEFLSEARLRQARLIQRSSFSTDRSI